MRIFSLLLLLLLLSLFFEVSSIGNSFKVHNKIRRQIASSIATRQTSSIPIENANQASKHKHISARSKQLISKGTLVLCAALFGSDFLCTKILQEVFSPSITLALRFSVASLPFFPLICSEKILSNQREIKTGIEIGLYNAAGYLCTSLSLQNNPVQKVAFVTSFAIVVIPIFDYLKGGHNNLFSLLAGPGLALLGLSLLIFDDRTSSSLFTYNDAVLLGIPLFFGIGMWRAETLVRQLNNYNIIVSGSNLLTVALSAILFAIFTNELSMSTTIGIIQELMNHPFELHCLLYMGFVATTLVTVLEQLCLRHVAARDAAVIYSLEPIFGTLFATIWYNELITKRIILASFLIICGNIFSYKEQDNKSNNSDTSCGHFDK